MQYIVPSNLGWLEDKLTTKEIKLLWNYILEANVNAKPNLVGHLHESLYLKDKKNQFFDRTLIQYCSHYAFKFGNQGDKIPTTGQHQMCLESFWVNRMRKYDFNPFHNHFGVYSFVIWLDIPTDYAEQYATTEANDGGSASNFEFMYPNILGEITTYKYQLSEESNGTILFFPSKLMHGVYPFYNCDDERISVSGNIAIKTN